MKKKTDKKKGKHKIDNDYSYRIAILDWEIPYSFSVNRNKNIISGPFWENGSLEISGKVIQPSKIAGRLIAVTLDGSRRLTTVMEDPDSYDYEPQAVGTLTLRGKQSEFLGFIPFDSLQSILILLDRGKINTLMLTGQELYHGHADIHYIELMKDSYE